MKKKWLAYLVVLLSFSVLNLFYYRQYFLEFWMRYNLGNEYIVVSLSTTPYRINDLSPTLETLFAQNAPIKQIYLNIPYHFERDNIEYQIPQYLLDEPRITILRTKDYGPATKLLGTLEKADLPPEAIIVTVDDDSIYPKNLVLQLAYKAMQHPDRAIGIMGANPDYDANGSIPEDSELGLIKIKQPNALVSVLQGYAGVAYRRHFFDDTVFDIAQAPKDCILSDDLYLSFYLAKHGIERQVLKNAYISSCDIGWDTPIGTSFTALHKLSPKPTDKHRSCLAFMHQQDPQVVF